MCINMRAYVPEYTRVCARCVPLRVACAFLHIPLELTYTCVHYILFVLA